MAENPIQPLTMREALGEIEIEVAGLRFYCARSLETLKAIEETVGAAAPFGRRLEAGSVRPEELANLFSKLLVRTPKAPTWRQIAEWSSENSPDFRRLGLWIFTLAIGEETLSRALGEASDRSAAMPHNRNAITERTPNVSSDP